MTAKEFYAIIDAMNRAYDMLEKNGVSDECKSYVKWFGVSLLADLRLMVERPEQKAKG